MWEQDPVTVPAVAVVNALLHRAVSARQADFAPSKIHDLLYLAHGLRLARAGLRLTADGIHADAEGVFSPSVRAAGCRGTRRLLRPLTRMLPDGETGILREQIPLLPGGHPVNALLDEVWSRWGAVPAFELRDFVCEPGAPWDLVWNQDGTGTGTAPRRIPDSTIRCWFTHVLGVEPAEARPRPSPLQRPAQEADGTQLIGDGMLRPV